MVTSISHTAYKQSNTYASWGKKCDYSMIDFRRYKVITTV